MGGYADPVDAAKRWLTATTQCHEFANQYPNRVTEIHYEDLCQNPERLAESLFSFLDLSYSNNITSKTDHLTQLGDINAKSHYSNVSQPINTSSIGKGSKTLSESQLAQLRPILSSQMKKFEYQ